MDETSVSPQLSEQPTWRISSELRHQLIEALLAAPEQPIRRKMAYEEFLAWADEDTLAYFHCPG